jgi:murein DD-endopeptidase MepM/ murein hydrolase activator NlpD
VLKAIALAGSVLLLIMGATRVAHGDWISTMVRYERNLSAANDMAVGGAAPEPQVARRGFDFSFLTRRVKGRKALSRIREPLNENDLMVSDRHVGMDMTSELRAVERPAILELRKYATIESGDTLVKILNSQGLARSDVNAINQAVSQVFDLRKLMPGWPVSLNLDASIEPMAPGRLISLHFEPSEDVTVSVERTPTGFAAHRDETVYIEKLMIASGTIRKGFWKDAKALGLPDRVVANAMQTHECVTDFKKDIQIGDKFSILFDARLTEDGRIINSQKIHYVAFETRRGKREVFRYERKNATGYYDSDAKQSCAAAFSLIRAPLARPYRMSSPFNPRRKHPITGKIRPHRGVDYAASKGTKIFAAGDGVVIAKRTHSGGYGKHVIIKHNDTYQSLYAHMSRFPKNLRVGSRVQQGQVVGYVGTTGSSTGNHLHFEIKKYGKQIDPVKSKLPAGQKLSGSARQSFFIVRDNTRRMIADAEPVIAPET